MWNGVYNRYCCYIHYYIEYYFVHDIYLKTRQFINSIHFFSLSFLRRKYLRFISNCWLVIFVGNRWSFFMKANFVQRWVCVLGKHSLSWYRPIDPHLNRQRTEWVQAKFTWVKDVRCDPRFVFILVGSTPIGLPTGSSSRRGHSQCDAHIEKSFGLQRMYHLIVCLFLVDQRRFSRPNSCTRRAISRNLSLWEARHWLVPYFCFIISQSSFVYFTKRSCLLH